MLVSNCDDHSSMTMKAMSSLDISKRSSTAERHRISAHCSAEEEKTHEWCDSLDHLLGEVEIAYR